MTEKLNISMPIIVEGKYDKIKLASVCNADIFTTDGFSIFNSKEKLALFARLAKKNGIIIMTDSDGAGTVIRRHISNAIPADKIFHLRIPKIKGKERRKSTASAEGTLGVEGMEAELIRKLLLPYSGGCCPRRAGITKAMLYEHGLSGGEGSAARRDKLAAVFDLPDGMTANALLSALNILTDAESFEKAAKAITEG
jgi:ribonuclease M5